MNKLLTATVLVAATAHAQTASPQAQGMTQEQVLTRLFSATEAQAEWFAPEFLKQVPLATIQQQLQGISAQYGKFVKMATLEGKPQAIYERGSLIVTLAPVDAQGRLTNFGAVPGPGTEPDMTPEQQQLGVQVLTALMAADPLDTALLSENYLKAVPADVLRASFAGIRASLGAFQGVSAQARGWTLQFARGTLPVSTLSIDERGKITHLVWGIPAVQFADLQEAQAAFAALPGDVSLLVQQQGQAPAVTLNASKLLGVGSAFKLGILSEAQAQVNAGKLKWTDEVTLTDNIKSLPSGTLQDAPAGTKYSVQDLATRMIRDSDNTATDLLLELVGRRGVEARLGQSVVASTREFFALKNPANVELLRAYRAAGLNSAARREVLKAANTAPLPGVKDFDGTRTLARDVEWFVSNRRLCQIMNDVAALPATQASPGVTSKDDFQQVSYKGGSEPGVLNLTTQVVTKAGKTYCVSATWNDSTPLNDSQFFGLYAGLMKLLK